MNVLDSVASPHGFLNSMARVLKPNGRALLGCPYDWTTSVTPVEAWVGGHSQHSEECGEKQCSIAPRLLTPGNHPSSIAELEIVSEIEQLPWTLRLHDRSTMSYQVHLLNLRKRNQ